MNIDNLSWGDVYQGIVAIIEETNNYPTKEKHPDFYDWMKHQQANKCLLTADQIIYLRKLDKPVHTVKNRDITAWKTSYKKIVAIVKNAGGLPTATDDKVSFDWLYRQKMNADRLTVEQKQLLEELPGFTFDSELKSWADNSKATLNIIRETGKPPNHVTETRLYNWWKTQLRNRHKLSNDKRKKIDEMLNLIKNS